MSAKVFVSSTWEDLQPERLAVEKVVHRMAELAFAGMEYFGASPRSARDESLERIASCHVWVGIFGGRYGSGITAAEYRRASELGLPCYVYFKAESAIPPEHRESDPEKVARLAELKTELRDSFHGHLSPEFSTPDGLAALVGTDLHNWLLETYLAPRLARATQAGRFPEVRALVAQTLDPVVLRGALERAGIDAGGDPVVDLLALGSPRALQILFRGPARHPTDYDTRFRNYFSEYLGTPRKTVPFGGRSRDLERLDDWLDDPGSPPYLLLTAGAGRGKSALLVHWGRRLLSREDVAVIHLPVSIRFRTNLATVAFSRLAAELADIHGEDVPAEINTSIEVWRGIVSDFLQRRLPDGRRLVVILDGLDEAADWQAGPDLFPLQPPPGLRLVVSARHTVDVSGAEAWRRRLGWEDHGLARAFDLEPLDAAGVGDVLARMDFPGNDLGRRGHLVAQLHRLSEGDPLLVRLYVEDLWEHSAETARLRPEDLQAIPPGLEGYFDRWWREQRELWGRDAPLQEKGVQALLSILTCAFGPLTGDDLLALAPEESGLTSWTLDDTLLPLSRFVVRDGNEAGYVLRHPRFGLYLQARSSERERRAWDRRFVAWGKEVLAHLVDGSLDPGDAPAYLVQYLGSHFERTKAPLEDLRALVCEGWKRAWLAVEGSYSGFMGDIDRAWRAAAVVDLNAATDGRPAPLSDEIHLALCRASLHSLAANVPPALLGRLVEEGARTARQALAYARQIPMIPSSAQRAEALAQIAKLLPEENREGVRAEATAAVPSEPAQRVETLVKLLPLLDPAPVSEFKAAVRHKPRPIRNKSRWHDVLLAAALALLEKGKMKAALQVADEEDGILTPMALRLCDLDRLGDVERIAGEAEDPGGLWIKVLVHLAARGTPAQIRAALAVLESQGLHPEQGLRRLLEATLARHAEPGSLPLQEEDEEWLGSFMPDEAWGRRWIDLVELADLGEALAALRPQVSAAIAERLTRRVEETPTIWGSALLVLLGHEELSALADLPEFLRRCLLLLLSPAISPHNLDSFLAFMSSPDRNNDDDDDVDDVDDDDNDDDDEPTKGTVIQAVSQTLARKGMSAEAASVLDRLKSPAGRARILAVIWDDLPDDVRARKAREVLSLKPRFSREEGFPLLYRKLSGPLLREAVTAHSVIADEGLGDLFKSALASWGLSPEDRSAALTVPREFSSFYLRSIFLAMSFLVASEPAMRWTVEEILSEVATQEEPSLRLLASLVKLLPDPLRSEVRHRIWDHLGSLGDADLLRNIGTLLEIPVPPVWQARIPDLQRKPDRYEHIWEAFGGGEDAWAVHLLPPGEREEAARRLVTRVKKKHGAVEDVRLALPFLPAEELAGLIDRWLRFPAKKRAKAVVILAPLLPACRRPEALAVARRIKKVEHRDLALAGLLPFLSEEDQRQIVQEAMSSEEAAQIWFQTLWKAMRLFSPEHLDAICSVMARELTPPLFEILIQVREQTPGVWLPRAIFLAVTSFDRATLCRSLQHVLRPGRICLRIHLLSDLAALAPSSSLSEGKARSLASWLRSRRPTLCFRNRTGEKAASVPALEIYRHLLEPEP